MYSTVQLDSAASSPSPGSKKTGATRLWTSAAAGIRHFVRESDFWMHPVHTSKLALTIFDIFALQPPVDSSSTGLRDSYNILCDHPTDISRSQTGGIAVSRARSRGPPLETCSRVGIALLPPLSQLGRKRCTGDTRRRSYLAGRS